MQAKNRETILGRLVEDSRAELEKGFDHSATRKKIITEKSMFRGNIDVKEVIKDLDHLKAEIQGTKYVRKRFISNSDDI